MKPLIIIIISLVMNLLGVYSQEKISPLLNQTWLYSSGSHGLTVKPHSTTYIFAGIWTQLIEIKFPIDLNDEIKIINSFVNCTEMAEDPDDYCGDYFKMVDTMVMVLRSYRGMALGKLAHLIRDTPLHTWFKRSKRSLIPFIGNALSALFGTAVNSDVKEVKRNFDTLNDEIERQKKTDAFLQKQLLGLSKIVKNSSESFDKNMQDIVSKIVKLDLFMTTYMANSSIVVSNLRIARHIDLKFNEGLINVIIGVLKNMRLMENIYDIELALKDLRAGRLPIRLLPWIVLKPILEGIYKEISPMYELGIEEQNWDLYYNLPLTKFTFVEGGFLLKLNIPIKVKHTNVKYEVYQPITSPIPCNTSFCKWNNRIKNNDTYITLDLKNNLWLTDNKYMYIKGEIQSHSLDCINVANDRLCVAYDRSLIIPTTACTSSLWEWKTEKITQYCKFEISLSEVYTPIQLSQNLFLIHQKAIPKFDYICIGGQSKSREVKHWCEEISIEIGCYIKAQNTVIIGPLKYRDTRLDVIQSQHPKFLFDLKLDVINKNFNKKSKESVKKTTTKIPPQIKYESNRDSIQLNPGATTAAIDRLWSDMMYETEKVNYVIEKMSHTSTTTHLNAAIDSISSFLLFISFATIIVHFLSHGTRFLFIYPVIIPPIEAIRFEKPESSANIFQTYKEEPVFKSFQLILIMIGFLIFVVIYYFKIFRSYKLKYFIGDYHEPTEFFNNNCFINICFKFISRRWLLTTINEVTIRMNADFLENSLINENIVLESTFKTWSLIRKDHYYAVCIPSGIRLIISNNERVEERVRYRVEMPVDVITWKRRRVPDFENAVQVFGDVFLSFYKLSTMYDAPTNQRQMNIRGVQTRYRRNRGGFNLSTTSLPSAPELVDFNRVGSSQVVHNVTPVPSNERNNYEEVSYIEMMSTAEST